MLFEYNHTERQKKAKEAEAAAKEAARREEMRLNEERQVAPPATARRRVWRALRRPLRPPLSQLLPTPLLCSLTGRSSCRAFVLQLSPLPPPSRAAAVGRVPRAQHAQPRAQQTNHHDGGAALGAAQAAGSGSGGAREGIDEKAGVVRVKK